MRQVLTLVCILGVMPLLTGLLFSSPGRRGGGSCAYAYLTGLLTLLGAFQVMALPMGYLHTSLKKLCLVFLGTGAVLCLAGVLSFIIRRKMLLSGIQGRNKGSRHIAPLMAVVLICILFQMVFVTEKQHIDEDDAYYLGTAVNAVEYDGLYTRDPYTGKKVKADPEARYMLASWPLFIAVLSKVSDIQAVKLAHMVLPAVVLLWCYLVYFLLAGWLYPEKPGHVWRFMFFVVLMHTFAGYSIYNAQVFVMIRSWQGKAVLCGVGLPALTYVCLLAMGREKWGRNWSLLTVTITALTCFTTIGTIFSIIVTGCFALYHFLRTRRAWYLFNSAVACLPALACSVIYLMKRG